MGNVIVPDSRNLLICWSHPGTAAAPCLEKRFSTLAARSKPLGSFLKILLFGPHSKASEPGPLGVGPGHRYVLKALWVTPKCGALEEAFPFHC